MRKSQNVSCVQICSSVTDNSNEQSQDRWGGVYKCFNAKCIEVLSDDFNHQHQHQESQALACKCLVTTPAGTLWLLSSQQRCIATCNETSTLPDERSTLVPHALSTTLALTDTLCLLLEPRVQFKRNCLLSKRTSTSEINF